MPMQSTMHNRFHTRLEQVKTQLESPLIAIALGEKK
jgi:hypothetical protein